MGQPVGPEQFSLRTDDLKAYGAAIRAGLGIGFVAAYLLREDADVVQILPDLGIPPVPA